MGGDFYWARKVKNGTVLAVGDCTGHGVPGALMTMAVNSILDHIIDNICSDDPAEILKNLNKLVRETLNNRERNNTTDDGLDIGVCFIDNKRLIFSGAKISLYLRKANELVRLKGNNKSLGYKRIEEDYEYINHEIHLEVSDVLYISTDGYPDQNGGDKNNSFGRKKLEELINENFSRDIEGQRTVFERELIDYMGNEPQRDDITLLCVRI